MGPAKHKGLPAVAATTVSVARLEKARGRFARTSTSQLLRSECTWHQCQVRKQIDSMVAALKEEQAAEVKKKDYCIEELQKNRLVDYWALASHSLC